MFQYNVVGSVVPGLCGGGRPHLEVERKTESTSGFFRPGCIKKRWKKTIFDLKLF